MDSEELLEKYKSFPLYARVSMAMLLGLMPGFYNLYEEGDRLSQALSAAEMSRSGAEAEFNRLKRRQSDLPSLEEKLAFTENQLEQARSKMPNEVAIESILQTMASLALETGAELRRFIPQPEVMIQGAFSYAEVPIRVELEGSYMQIAQFADEVVHLETFFHVRDMNMTRLSERSEVDEAIDERNLTGNPGDLKPEELANIHRSVVRVRATADLVVYRGLKDGEVIAPGGPGAANSGPGQGGDAQTNQANQNRTGNSNAANPRGRP